jgi:hypothetical protein
MPGKDDVGVPEGAVPDHERLSVELLFRGRAEELDGSGKLSLDARAVGRNGCRDRAVPSRLWPQPWPGPFSTSASFFALPAAWEKASAARRTPPAEPRPAFRIPRLAEKAVASPPIPHVTRKPSFSSSAASAAEERFSSAPSPASPRIFQATATQRARVWSSHAVRGRLGGNQRNREKNQSEGRSKPVHLAPNNIGAALPITRNPFTPGLMAV